MDYDKILIHIGEFGLYHIGVYTLVCLPAVFVAMNMLSYVFNSASPQHRCFIPGCDNSSTSFQEPWINTLIPKSNSSSDFKFSQCERYFILPNNESDVCPPGFNLSQVACDKWVYDDSTYHSTVVSEWNLVCDKDWQAPLSGSLWMVGVIVGAIIFGDLSDRFGRRRILLFSIVLCSTTGFIVPYSVNYVMFLVIRLIQAAATTGIYQTAFVLGLEVVGQSKRVFCGIGISMAFAIGEVFLGALAYFIRDWRTLQLYLAIPNAIFLLYFFILPESVRWLISQGRYCEARESIKKIAAYNKASIPLELLHPQLDNDLDSTSARIIEDKQSSVKVSVLDLFRTPRLRCRTLNIFLNWFMNTIGYYGISMNATNLQGDTYLDFILTSLVEVPAYIFCLLVMNRWGRKKPLISCMVIGGLCSMSTILVPDTPDYKWVSIGLSLVGKFGSAAAFAIIYVFSVELFPTVLRNNGIGLSSTFAHVGGVIVPYIATLSTYGRAVPLVIFGSSSLLAGLFAFFLPETLHQKLPETVADAENFGRKKRFSDDVVQEECVALINDRDEL